MSTFRVGQRVVCVKPHPYGWLIKGNVYTVTGVGSTSCCKIPYITVGIIDTKLRELPIGDSVTCGGCYKIFVKTTHEWRIGQFRFRPIQEQSVSAELATELLERLVQEKPEHVNEPELA